MNCLEFRRQLGTQPRARDEGMQLHAASCAGCRVAAANAHGLELQIEQALRGVPAPAGLSARIVQELNDLNDRTDEPPHESKQPRSTPISLGRRRWLAAAGIAALSATGVLGYTLVRAPTQLTPSLDEAIVQIIRDEVLTLTSRADIGPDELRLTLDPIGLSLKTPLENVRFATNCVIRGRTAAHWVLEGNRAPVTVFVMPEEILASRSVISAGSMHGLVLPTHRGSIAIVGTKGERLEDVGRRVRAAVNWTA